MNTPFHLLKPLEPIDAGAEARYRPIEGIRAVLFDVYGTIVISSSGDIGAVSLGPESAVAALREQRIRLCPEGCPDTIGARAILLFRRTIDTEHRRLRDEGIEYPEIDIARVWRQVIDELAAEGCIALERDLDDREIESFATVFEMLSNPTWPMPHLRTTLDAIRQAGLALGIVSNAQFFTPPLLNHFLDSESTSHDAPVSGFDSDLCFFSFRYGHAKPSLRMYQEARSRLKERGIAPAQALYVGNDMLKDIYPASSVGFRTVLFAGDSRSLRLRQGDPRVAGLEPDAIVTSLESIREILSLDSSR